MNPLSIYNPKFNENCIGWTIDDINQLYKIRFGFVYIPNTGDLKFINVLRRCPELELIPVADPEKEWNEYKKNYKETRVNIKRLDFIKTQRNTYQDLGVHPLACIGSDGMGYGWDGGEWLEFPQKGGVKIGKNVRVGEFTSIKKGTIQDTVIGEGTKIGSHCNIGHNVKIGKHCLIIHRVSIGGSTEIGSNTIIWQGVIIRNKIRIGNNCEIMQGSNIQKDVPDNTRVNGIYK